MYSLFVFMSRFIFMFCIVIFLYQSITYIISERSDFTVELKNIIFNQKVVTILMHVTGFVIISLNHGEDSLSIYTLVTGGAFLLFYTYAQITLKLFYKSSCPLIWNIVFFISDIGLIMLMRYGGEYSTFAQKQLVWIFTGYSIGLIVPFIFKIVNKLKNFEFIFIILGYLLLLSPFIIGKVQNGALNWVQFYGISFQPSEFVKVLFLFFLASAFGKKLNIRKFIIYSLVAAGFIGILVIQKDLGGALIYFSLYLILMYISTGATLLTLIILAFAVVSVIVAYNVFPYFSFTENIFSHLQKRMISWQNPFSDITGAGYQIAQALFAIGTWGLFGAGLTEGVSKFNLPFVETDMIFAGICEEFGALFGIIMIVLYFVLVYKCINIAINCKDKHNSLLCSGLSLALAIQTFLIIGGVINLVPLTGVTLPFVSYGGSSVIVSYFMIALISSINAYNKREEVQTSDTGIIEDDEIRSDDSEKELDTE